MFGPEDWPEDHKNRNSKCEENSNIILMAERVFPEEDEGRERRPPMEENEIHAYI